MSGNLANRQFIYGIFVVGVLVVLASFLIDPLRGHAIYLAPIQIAGVVVGVVLMLAALYLNFSQKDTHA